MTMGDRPREGMITIFYGNPAEADVGGGFDTVLPGDLWDDLEGGMWRFNGWCWVEIPLAVMDAKSITISPDLLTEISELMLDDADDGREEAPLSPTQHDQPLR